MLLISNSIVTALQDILEVSSYIDSRLENIKHFLNGFVNLPNEIYMDDLDPDDESADTPLVSSFLDSDDDSDDGEVLNELEEYGSFSYSDPFLPMNIIMCKGYNTIMVEGLKSTRRNLVVIVKDVYVFVGSFTYVTDFVILEDIEEIIVSDMAKVVMGKPFRNITQIEYDCVKALVSFTRILDNYTF
nr:MAK10-like protein [Tanacetum cinerariifolium]